MSRPKKASEARTQFKNTVNSALSAIDSLIEIVRTKPADFSVEDIEKMRSFFGIQLNAAADTMVIAIKSDSGGMFSFDMELPSVAPAKSNAPWPVLSGFAPSIAGVLAPALNATGETKATGRLVGSKEVLVEAVTEPQRGAGSDPEVGFIEEA